MGHYYHFTSRTHLPWILDAGYLRTTDSILDANNMNAAPPCVWLLDMPSLEGHSHGLFGSAVDKTEVRFTVEIPDKRVIKWVDWALTNGIDPEWYEIMVRVGGGQAAADHWRCVFRRIPREQWITVDALGPDGSYSPIPWE